MASFDFQIDPALYADLLKLEQADIDGGLKAGADLLAAYTVQEGKRMGVLRTGKTLSAVTTKGPYGRGDNKYFYVTYDGIHHYYNSRKKGGLAESRNGEVAFVNEYGARGRPARPFNRAAVEGHESEITREMENAIFGAV